MFLNSTGRTVSGVGSVGVWVDNVQILVPNAGKPAFLTDGEMIYQDENTHAEKDDWALYASDLQNHNERKVSHKGATWIVAAGGQWAAFLADGQTGVYASWGLSLPDACVLGMTADTLFVRTSYQTGGVTAYAVGAMTPLWSMVGAVPVIQGEVPQFFALARRCFVWMDANHGLCAEGLPSPQTQGHAFDPFIVEIHGAVWLGYHVSNPDLFLLHPIDDASRGYVVATGLTFGTIGQVQNNEIVCYWATGPAENGNIQRRAIVPDPATMVPLGVLESPTAPTEPRLEPHQTPTPIPTPIPAPSPEPEIEEPMELPRRGVYLLGHNSNIAAVVPGSVKLDMAYPAQETGGYQEVEILPSQNAGRARVRFIAGNRLARVDTVLALQQKYDQAVQTYDPAAPDADSGWQNPVIDPPYLHFLGPAVNGRLGVLYTFTMVDKDLKPLFR